MVVNLVRSGRKQPQLFSASAGGKARHLRFGLIGFGQNGRSEAKMRKFNKTFSVAAGLFFGIASSSVAAVDGMSIQGGAGAGFGLGLLMAGDSR